VSDDLERLPDIPATFPRPDPGLTEEVRRKVLAGRPPRRGRRLGITAAAAVVFVATIGFTAGHWLIPPGGAAAAAVSLSVRPTVVQAYDPLTAYGVAGSAAGEPVSLEAKECGSYAGFHLVAGTQTGANGAWAADVKNLTPGITTTYRARWKDQISGTVTVRVHPWLFLQRLNGFFALTVRVNDIFRGRRAVVERYASNGWVRVKSIVIKSYPGYGQGGFAQFRTKLPRGTHVRVVLSQAQAGHCFLPGFSNIVRV